jgi:hypothetical protein
MRRIIDILGVFAVCGLIFATAPSPAALANQGGNQPPPGCGSGLCTFSAAGDGSAVDDLFATGDPSVYVGCYAPASGDPLLLNDNPEMACPTPGSGSQRNLSCGCVMAGGVMPSGTDVYLTGDSQHGNWTLTQLELSFAFGNNDATSGVDFFIGLSNGTGNGLDGCYGASGFATLVSYGTRRGPITKGQTAYLELQGTICDTIPFSLTGDPNPVEPQKGSFSGSFSLDPARSSSFFQNFSGTGTFVITLDDVSARPSAYSDAQFSFLGFLAP